jgi:hypothetical protein
LGRLLFRNFFQIAEILYVQFSCRILKKTSSCLQSPSFGNIRELGAYGGLLLQARKRSYITFGHI